MSESLTQMWRDLAAILDGAPSEPPPEPEPEPATVKPWHREWDTFMDDARFSDGRDVS